MPLLFWRPALFHAVFLIDDDGVLAMDLHRLGSWRGLPELSLYYNTRAISNNKEKRV
jgi:hypothetical protein